MSRKKIVYDLDDTLNNLMDYICSILSIPLPDTYNIKQCSYTENTKERIIQMFQDADVFGQLSFAAGADELREIRKLGDVYIYSICYTPEIAEIKRKKLLKADLVDSDKIILKLTDVNGHKEALDFADIIVEDHADNLLEYPKESVKILINKTYNSSLILEDGIIRAKNLTEANEIVMKALSQ